MFRWLVLTMLLAVPPSAGAARRVPLPVQTELTMLLTGSISVDPMGNVTAWEVDSREKVPVYVQRIVDASAAKWKFDPVVVDGKARHARARMSLRMVANKQEDGNFQVAIRNAYFGRNAEDPVDRPDRTDELRSMQLTPPEYPRWAYSHGVRGTVYVALRVNREGAVEEAEAEQVNLKTTGSEAQQKQMRDVLAASALAAAKRWKFRVPTTGEKAARDHWSARVPVTYAFGDQEEVGYGQWEAYLPGPWIRPSWRTGSAAGDGPPDALVAGQSYSDGQGMKLLSPIQQDGS